MIRSFADRETERLWLGDTTRRFPRDILRRALSRLRQIDAAGSLDDLRVPPGNRLEALRGNRSGQYSIRINGQWRVCFKWHEGQATAVEIVDYH